MEQQIESTEFVNADLEQIAAQLQAEEMQEAAEQQAAAGELLEQQPEISTAEILQPVIDLACAVACPNWNIKQPERQALAQAYGDLVDKYFPEGVGQFGVELNALLVTAAILTPRLGTPRHKEEQPDGGENGKKSE